MKNVPLDKNRAKIKGYQTIDKAALLEAQRTAYLASVLARLKGEAPTQTVVPPPFGPDLSKAIYGGPLPALGFDLLDSGNPEIEAEFTKEHSAIHELAKSFLLDVYKGNLDVSEPFAFKVFQPRKPQDVVVLVPTPVRAKIHRMLNGHLAICPEPDRCVHAPLLGPSQDYSMLPVLNVDAGGIEVVVIRETETEVVPGLPNWFIGFLVDKTVNLTLTSHSGHLLAHSLDFETGVPEEFGLEVRQIWELDGFLGCLMTLPFAKVPPAVHRWSPKAS